MNELERYIRERYEDDKIRLEDLRLLAAEAFPTIANSWRPHRCDWPYEAFGDKPIGREYSFSTNSMLLFMLATVLGYCETSSLIPRTLASGGLDSGDLGKEVEHAFEKGLGYFRQVDGGRYWDRTSDPCDVNTVLYR